MTHVDTEGTSVTGEKKTIQTFLSVDAILYIDNSIAHTLFCEYVPRIHGYFFFYMTLISLSQAVWSGQGSGFPAASAFSVRE